MNKLLAVTTAIAAFAAAQAHAAPISVNFYSTFTDTGSGIEFAGAPFLSDTVDDINITFATQDIFAADYKGAFLVPDDGSYDFTLASDDTGYLFFDGALIAHSNVSSQDFSASLSAGVHSFEFQYDDIGGPAGVYLTVDPRITFVTPSAVPEPASWALMLGGVALAGGALRRAYRRSEDDFTAKVREAAQA